MGRWPGEFVCSSNPEVDVVFEGGLKRKVNHTYHRILPTYEESNFQASDESDPTAYSDRFCAKLVSESSEVFELFVESKDVGPRPLLRRAILIPGTLSQKRRRPLSSSRLAGADAKTKPARRAIWSSQAWSKARLWCPAWCAKRLNMVSRAVYHLRQLTTQASDSRVVKGWGGSLRTRMYHWDPKGM